MQVPLDVRARQIFDEVFDASAEDRAAQLARCCGGDATLHARVEALLIAAELNDPFLSNPSEALNSASPAAELHEPNVGPFRLIELLGEGGFGSVYRARQSEPFDRVVALKIIKAGMDTRQVIARFELERRTLALMDHPNIARVLEAGATERGRPYFVMELVEGERITEFCDRQRLTIASRLVLFRQVCDAVQHAHQRGIIHRDLKPSNVLVAKSDGRPSVKVIDFGIAKAVAAGPTGSSLTAVGQAIGTPDYMSPEQITGASDDVDTRSDVYSLGVLLYELLTGATPYGRTQHGSSSAAKTPRASCDREPVQPSERLRLLAATRADRGAAPGSRTLTSAGSSAHDIAERRNTEPEALIRALRSDLDWIVLKCLERDRARRYETASALADDVCRYLENQPVQATPPTSGYRFRKFVRRNRVAVVAGAAIASAIMLGTFGTILGLVRAVESQREALERADEARAVNEFLRDIMTQVSPDAQGADVRLAQVLDRASVEIPAHFSNHPLQAARARELLADVYNTLTLFPHAQREAQAALELYQQHVHPDNPAALLCTQRCIAAAVNLAQAKVVEQLLEDALPRFARVFGPDDEHTQDLRRCEAWLHLRRGQVDQAEAMFLQLRVHPAQADDERQIRIIRHLMMVEKFRSNSVDRDQRRPYWASVESLAREATALAERRYGPDASATLALQLEVAEALGHLDCHEDAAQMCRAVLARDLSRLGPNHFVLREAYGTLADAIARLGQDQEAGALTLQKLNCVRNTTAPGNVVLIGALFQSLPFLERAGLAVEGESTARELIALVRPLGEDRSGHLLSAGTCLGRFLSMQNRYDEAEAVFAAEFERAEAAGPNGRIARLHLDYGLHLAARGAYEDAEAQLLEAVRQAGDVRAGTWYSHPDDLMVGFIELYRKWGKVEKVCEFEQLRAAAFNIHPGEERSLPGGP